ncbi:hypothetical protein HZB94_04185 [Candidatus Falkowbacteria bacterium]|nr:hypothetical protein [Candidatus Falkowbacteria bacterium]
MTVSKALRFVKSLKGQLSKLNSRALEILNWEKGKEPKADFGDVVAEKDRLTRLLIQVKAALCAANSTSFIEFEGVKILVQEAVYLMAELKGEKSFYEALQLHWSETIDFPRTVVTEGEKKGELAYKEVKRTFESAMTEEVRREKVEQIQKRMDELNDALEAHNHATTIVST